MSHIECQAEVLYGGMNGWRIWFDMLTANKEAYKETDKTDNNCDTKV